MAYLSQNTEVDNINVNEGVTNKNISYEIGYIVPFWSSYPQGNFTYCLFFNFLLD